MSITAADVQLLQSERMTDGVDGGGRMTSTQIIDGAVGAIFPKISRLDAVNGRFNLRKIYLAIRNTGQDTYAGAHAFITEPPTNSNIKIVMFSTLSHFDTRAEIRDRVESYVVAGPLHRMRLYGNQSIGQKALLTYQRTEEPLPDVGDVLCLSVEAVGHTTITQYVKIDEVSSETRTFTDATGDFQRRVLTLKLTTALVQTFVGAEPTRYSSDPSPTKIRATSVADTTKYYGLARIVDPVPAGALSFRVDSIYSPIVPSATRETAVSQAELPGAAGWVAAGARVTRSVGFGVGVGSNSGFATMGVLPGSFAVDIFNVRDYGDGRLYGDNGTTGTIDYESGAWTIIFAQNPGASWPNQSCVPAVKKTSAANSTKTVVTLANRGAVWTFSLSPLPAPGSVIVEYRSQGRWYRLRDNGLGALAGSSAAEGAGTVSYSSGALIVTLSALPDVGSAVLVSWGSGAHVAVRAGATANNTAATPRLKFTLANVPVKPGSVSISVPGSTVRVWSDGGAKVLTSSGGQAGSVDYVTGEIDIPALDGSGNVTLSAQVLAVSYQQESAATGDTVTTVTVGVANPASWSTGLTGSSAVSIRITCPISVPIEGRTLSESATVTLIDDGAGQLVTIAAVPSEIVWWSGGQVAGTINYSTGAVTLTGLTVSVVQRGPFNANSVASKSVGFAVGDYTVTRKNPASIYAAKTESISVAGVGILYDLTPTIGEPVVPGSVVLSMCGKILVDRSGSVYADVSPSTGAGTLVGTINYSTGVVKLTAWATQSAPVAAVLGCLTQHGNFSVVETAFRTAGSPVRPGSFSVRAADLDGVVVLGTADVNGTVSGTGVRGSVEASTGVCVLEFGSLQAGVWVSKPVYPDTIRYSCVVTRQLPLDPAIIGVDPVRLPSDGRVPILRAGDTVLIHHTGQVTLPNPAVAGATINAGRPCDAMELRDQDGKPVAAVMVASADLAAGTLTLAGALDLSAYRQPLIMRHRIEDEVVLSDAMITGDVSLQSVTTKAYPAGAYVSSGLLFGDMAAAVTKVFDLVTWASVWGDSIAASGASGATGEANDLQYPIIVTNQGAIKERWRAHVTSVSPLTVQIYGEQLGSLGSFSAIAAITPINPLTGAAYFSIPAGFWGAASQWAVGNNIRWNTEAAARPIDLARVTLPGAAVGGDRFDMQLRGDVD